MQIKTEEYVDRKEKWNLVRQVESRRAARIKSSGVSETIAELGISDRSGLESTGRI